MVFLLHWITESRVTGITKEREKERERERERERAAGQASNSQQHTKHQILQKQKLICWTDSIRL